MATRLKRPCAFTPTDADKKRRVAGPIPILAKSSPRVAARQYSSNRNVNNNFVDADADTSNKENSVCVSCLSVRSLSKHALSSCVFCSGPTCYLCLTVCGMCEADACGNCCFATACTSKRADDKSNDLPLCAKCRKRL